MLIVPFSALLVTRLRFDSDLARRHAQMVQIVAKSADAAREMREATEYDRRKELLLREPVTKYVLPTTKGFPQGGSQLCWAYATINALETLYLARHPGVTLELSRGFVQHSTWNDRLERRLTDSGAELSDRGTGMNAIRLIEERGIVQFDDYRDVAPPYVPDIAKILDDVESLPSPTAKIRQIGVDLDGVYGPQPKSTQFAGANLSVIEFGRSLVGATSWTSYALSAQGQPEGWGLDPDPDARGDYQVFFASLGTLQRLIRKALQAGAPVVFSNINHLTMIYGAEYDSTGEPTLYYIKDSYASPDYFYQASAAALHAKMREITSNAKL
jgi:hypothetical protein